MWLGCWQFPAPLHAQYGTGKAITRRRLTRSPQSPRLLPAPAPTHDLSGVWMMRNPPGVQSRIHQFHLHRSQNEPALTDPLGRAEIERGQGLEWRSYTLDQTNDPVLTQVLSARHAARLLSSLPIRIRADAEISCLWYTNMITRSGAFTSMDGRIPNDPDLSWMGTSVGHWEGDTTFVVDTVGFNEKTWLDRLGHAHSEQLHVTERFRRVDQRSSRARYNHDGS